MCEQIQYVRQQLVEGRQEDARVLVVDKISQCFLQILGVAIDLDPTFLWRHCNQHLDSDLYSSGMATRRNRYFSLGPEESHDTFGKVLNSLTVKSSLFAKETKPCGVDKMFGERDRSLTPTSFGIVFGRLLEVSRWEWNIRTFDRHLGQLSANAMLEASLNTFRPIPTLRQNVADLREALQEASDSVGKADTTTFSELQDTTSNRLETLESVFEVLLKRTDALSARISNEIQLVIGSVTIQACFPDNATWRLVGIQSRAVIVHILRT